RNPSLDNLKISSARLCVYRGANGNIESVFPKKPEQPLSVESDQNAGSPGKTPEKAQPSKEAPATAIKGREFSWPIKDIEVESSEVIVQLAAVDFLEPVQVSFEKIRGTIKRRDNSLDFSITGTPHMPGVENSELVTRGVVKVSPDFSSIENADVKSQLAYARLKSPWFLPPSASVWIDRSRVTDVDLNIRLRKGESPRFDISATMFKANGSSGLKFSASGTLAPDFSGIQELTIKGDSDTVPVVGVGKVIPKQILDQFGPNGSINLNFKGSWTHRDGWSAGGSARFNDFPPSGKYTFLGKQLAANLSFEITPDSFLIRSMDIQNELANNLISIKGSIKNPFSSDRSFDLESRIHIHGSWLRPTGLDLPKDLSVSGPVPIFAHLSGPSKSLKLDMNGDLSAASLSYKSVFEKETGIKAGFKASTVLALNSPHPLDRLFKQLNIRLRVKDTTIKLVSGFQPIDGCPVDLDVEIDKLNKSLDLKNLSLKIALPGNRHSLLSATGHIKRINSPEPELNIDGNLFVSHDAMELSGLPTRLPVDADGIGNLNFKLAGSPKSLKWSLSAPLKDLRFTVGDWLVKRRGLELELVGSGTRSRGDIRINQARIKTPGFNGVVSGEMSGKASFLKVDTADAEIGALANLFPALAHTGLSGKFNGLLTIDLHAKGFPVNGRLQLISMNYRPNRSPLMFEKISGDVQVNGGSVESKEIRGHVRGTIDAPVRASLNLTGLQNPKNLSGRISLSAGPGKLAAERLRSILSRAEALVQPFLNNNGEAKKFNPFDLKTVTADLQIDSGVVKTDDFKLKASELSIGAIGNVDLKSRNVDILSYVRTSSAPLAAIGSIPVVKDIIKKNEGLLKITGLDKELKKLGIEESQKSDQNKQEQPSKPQSINVIFKIAGLWAEPTFTPILEGAVPGNELSRLKELVK
ncbi:MAG: AsmA-like C-terminal region-containing protein, partial [Desulfomonilaceae bacterium]